MHEEHGNKSSRVGSISKKSGNSDGTTSSIVERKSFPSDIEKNSKQCMAITLRSGKQLDGPKKIKDDEKQVQ